MSTDPFWEPSTLSLDRPEAARTLAQAMAATPGCCLVVHSGGEAGRALMLQSGANVLGRSPQVALQLDHPGISRRHAELQVDGTRVLLKDLGSANGSYHNDARVVAPVLLADGDLVRLGSVVLKFYRQRSLDVALHDRLYRLAMVDEGTGVFNRRYLVDALRRAVLHARQDNTPLCVVGIDLDRFKAVNDRYGHQAGDRVLRGSAQALQSALPASAVLARLGGEEFIALLPGLDLPAARAVAERLRAAVAALRFSLRPMVADNPPAEHTLSPSASFGVAALLPGMAGGDDLLAAADRWVYTAKAAGRNCVQG